MSEENKKNSKFLSLVLRHRPESIGITLDENGWANVTELITKMNDHGAILNRDLLKAIVETNDKKRFAFNEDCSMIRASQGHSITVDLLLKPMAPPPHLYHGTVEKFVDAIRESGLLKMERQQVHLSEEIFTAQKVGSRRGKPVILTILSAEMFRDGFLFYLSENGVWLCNHVPSKYILFNS